MRNFVKIFAIVLAVLMLGSVMVACDKGGETTDTTAETQAAAVAVNVNLSIKDATGKEVYKGAVSVKNATLGEAIEMFCAGEDVECIFDESTGLLTKIGDVVPADGQIFIAYDETQGKTKAFDSIKDQVITEGQTIIVAID